MLLSIDLASHQIVEVDMNILATSTTISLVLAEQSLKLILEAHDHIQAIAIEDFKYEHLCVISCLSDSDSTSKDALIIQMRLIDQILNHSSRILWLGACSWFVQLGEHLYWPSWCLILFEEEKLQVAAILKSPNQVQALLGMPILQLLVEFDVEGISFEVGATQRNCLNHKLLGELWDILGEPTGKLILVYILMRAEHDDELVPLHGAMTQTDRHKELSCTLIDQS